ncbi:MAG: hypothetical protein JWQ03_1624 [Variovorax sp.]|nr:hypothetical protein [Variovorax sp.]
MKNPMFTIRFLRHFIVVVWRQQRGRWYYMRDRPQWFVEELAAIAVQAGGREDVRAILQEARDEQIRRLDHRLRELEARMREDGMPDLAELLASAREALRVS